MSKFTHIHSLILMISFSFSPLVGDFVLVGSHDGHIPKHLEMQQRIDAERQEREFRAHATLQTLMYEREVLSRVHYNAGMPPVSPETPPPQSAQTKNQEVRFRSKTQTLADFYRQESELHYNVQLKHAYKVLADYLPSVGGPEQELLRSVLDINHDNRCADQRIATQEIVVFVAEAIELLQHKETIGKALDMLVIANMANKLNKSWCYAQARDFIKQYTLSSNFISHDSERNALNKELIEVAKAYSMLGFLEGHVPHFLLNCSTMTLCAMDAVRNHNVPLKGQREALHVIRNLGTTLSGLGHLSCSATKRTGWVALMLCLTPIETWNVAIGGLLGIGQALYNFNPVHAVTSIADAATDGICFLADFFEELNVDPKFWQQKYNYAEKVSAMCKAIENAKTQEIGQALANTWVDFALCGQTLGILGQTLSLCAKGVRQAVAPGTKIHGILVKCKKSLTLTGPELEFIAQEAYGLETLMFTEIAEELSVKLSPLSKRQPARLGGTAPKSAAHVAKLQTFELGLEDLVKQYGEKIMQDAQQALNINEYKIIKSTNLAQEVELVCSDIHKVVKDIRRQNFIYELDQGKKVSKRSISEALTACAAEDAGVCGELTRSLDSRYDFLDKLGNKWDVKEFNSYFINNPEYGFDFEVFVSKLQKELLLGEKILLDISYAEAEHLEKLYRIIDRVISSDEKINIKEIIRQKKYRS